MWPDTESNSDYLNFGEVSQLAVDILKIPRMLPVSLGIFGNWGAGKSTLLKLIEKDLGASEFEHIVVNFDAWLYQGYDDARAALLEEIATKLNEEAGGNEGLAQKTRKLLSQVDIFRVMGLAAEAGALVAGIPTGGLLARGVGVVKNLISSAEGESEFGNKEYAEATGVIEDGKKTLKTILKPESQTSPPKEIKAFRAAYGEILKELGRPLVVFIDNLDRCLPENAIHTLEAIRLFLFLPNTAFIIAADEEMIRRAVAEYYPGTSERHRIDYLDKLIQVPIRVPKSGIREVRAYLFMLFAIAHGVEEGNGLEKFRSGLEISLQQSWKGVPVTKEQALDLLQDISEISDLARSFELADRISPILATSPSIHGNPRIVKRLLNVVKMRASVAKRRGMPLDESIITKLVIFERCAGDEATADLYRIIDEENGKPKLLKQLEKDDPETLPGNSPESWKKHQDFIVKWAKLEPPLHQIDLRAAIYLSRETLPLGVYTTGLSILGRDALQVLNQITSLSSPEAKKSIANLPAEENVPVMEELIKQLRQITDWRKKPKGFAGACLLADQSLDAAKVLTRFISGIEAKPLWMKTMLKDKQWFKES